MKKLIEISAVDIMIYKFLVPLMKELRDNGWDISVCASDTGYKQKIVEEGFLVQTINIPRSLSPIKNVKALYHLIHYLIQEKPDCIHVHSPIAAMLARLAGKLTKVPHILYTIHGLNMKPPFLQVEKILCRYFTDYIFTVNEEDRRYLIDHNFIDKDHIKNINGVGVDTQVFDPNKETEEYKLKLKKELGLGNKPVIGFVGRLVKVKGILELIDAFNEVHSKIDCQLLVIGSAQLKERDTKTVELFKQKIKENDLERDVILAGHREDIPELLSIMDIFVLPSHWEGMPVCLLEAMSMGRPVIATDIRGTREELTSQSGIIIPVKDSQSLATAIEELLKDSDKAKTMGIEARKRVQKYFSTEQAVAKQMEIFDKMND